MFIRFFAQLTKLKKTLIEYKIFESNKIFVLRDPVFKIRDYCFSKKRKNF